MDVSPDPASILEDPLSQVCRRERRNLLAAGVAGTLVGAVGLVPTKVGGFGISLDSAAQAWFVGLLGVVIIYFIVAFVLYSLSDLMILRKKYHEYREAVEMALEGWSEDDQERYDEIKRRIGDISWVYRWSRPAVMVRGVFEFILPVLVGLCGILSLAIYYFR